MEGEVERDWFQVSMLNKCTAAALKQQIKSIHWNRYHTRVSEWMCAHWRECYKKLSHCNTHTRTHLRKSIDIVWSNVYEFTCWCIKLKFMCTSTKMLKLVARIGCNARCRALNIIFEYHKMQISSAQPRAHTQKERVLHKAMHTSTYQVHCIIFFLFG